MLYGRVIRRLASSLVVAAMLAGLGILASTGLPEAEASGATALELSQDTAAPKIAVQNLDRSALDTPAYRKEVPPPATLAPLAVVTGGARATATQGGTKPSAGSQLAQARAILAGLIRRYPILKGTTVTIGKTPGGYQAVAYYQSGRIVISPSHKASLSTILNHEVQHIIDWRDNGRIDWGEKVPSS